MTNTEDLAQGRRGAEKRTDSEINHVTEVIVSAGLEIHKSLGPGLLESVYESVLARELSIRGLHVQRQVALPVVWKGEVLDDAFRVDLIVEGKVIVELKSLEKSLPVHKKQLLTYLKLTGMQVGLLLNFGTGLFKDGIERLANGVSDQ
jgi:GxxExxY protein